VTIVEKYYSQDSLVPNEPRETCLKAGSVSSHAVAGIRFHKPSAFLAMLCPKFVKLDPRSPSWDNLWVSAVSRWLAYV
jgi:hypothetical protein